MCSSMHIALLDEKLLEDEHQVNKSKTYIAVCISATNGIVPVSNLKEKNLDIAPMDKIDSETASNTLVKVFNETSPNLVKRILGRMFDTINTNSGWKKEIIVRLKKHCGVKLLHLYCRHHICERIANDVSKVVLGNSESPETDVQKQLHDIWLWPNLDEPEPFLSLPRSIQLNAEKFIVFAISKLRSSFLNGNYNKVSKFSLILLGRYLHDVKTPTIHSMRAISHAGWMAKVIC